MARPSRTSLERERCFGYSRELLCAYKVDRSWLLCGRSEAAVRCGRGPTQNVAGSLLAPPPCCHRAPAAASPASVGYQHAPTRQHPPSARAGSPSPPTCACPPRDPVLISPRLSLDTSTHRRAQQRFDSFKQLLATACAQPHQPPAWRQLSRPSAAGCATTTPSPSPPTTSAAAGSTRTSSWSPLAPTSSRMYVVSHRFRSREDAASRPARRPSSLQIARPARDTLADSLARRPYRLMPG